MFPPRLLQEDETKFFCVGCCTSLVPLSASLAVSRIERKGDRGRVDAEESCDLPRVSQG